MSTTARGPSDSFRILVVGTDPGPLADLLEPLRAPAGFRLEGAPTAQAALARLEREPFDVALLDLDGAADGLELLRERAPSLPLVALAHSARPALADAALRHGAQDVLFRDRLDPLALARSVRSCGERRRLR